MDFKPGLYEDLDYETYASIPAWRSHDLTTIARCPFTWKNQRRTNESPALLEGRVQHTVFLEHHKFFDEFAIEPDVDRRTKDGKAAYAEWLEDLGDRTPIKQQLYDTCMERREVVKDYIPKEDHKVEFVVCFHFAGQPCKGRFDWYTGTDVWDLKTCRDASPRGFRAAINSFKYYQQAAFYMAAAHFVGLPAEKFYFLAQEKAHPYPYGIYTLSDEAIQYGHARNEQAMMIGLQCESNDEYSPFGLTGEVEFTADELY